MSRPPRRRRSCHAVPATAERMVQKAAGLPADLVFLDLEDSVAVALKGGSSRSAAAAALTGTTFAAPTVGLRVNAPDSPWWRGDIAEVIGSGARVDVVIAPKVEHPDQVDALHEALLEVESRLGLAPGHIGLEVQIETARGLVEVERIAARRPERVEALVFGPGDFAASLGMPTTTIGGDVPGAQGHAFHYALARIVTAARAFGLQAIDGPYGAFRDEDGLRVSAARSRALGFDGKWSIHPDQIPALNEAYSPTPEEIERARALLAATEGAASAGSGAASVGAEMIDEATRRMAESVLARWGGDR